jgi:formylglycine-generating enzyme required for sulfatase activity
LAGRIPAHKEGLTVLTTGTILQNRYRIVSLLGQGGMGAVYRAWHLTLNIPLAIKEMVPQPGLDAQTLVQMRQQFQQEAAILAHLDHPNLVRVIDHFEEGGNVYLVMDFVEGESLADCIAREGELTEDEVLVWAGQLLDALDYCHGQGVIHRDIKPQNVILRPDGRAVLVDFGLVKMWDPDDPHTRTVMRGMGTPEYAPPEQYSTQAGHTGPHSDVYSLGATLYHALTGQAPPPAADRTVDPSLLNAPRALNRRISRGVERAVLKALELRPDRRFQSARRMAAALKVEVPVPALRLPERQAVHEAPPAPQRRPTKVMAGVQTAVLAWWRRVPVWGWALGGMLGVAVLIVGVVSALGGGPATGALPVTPTARRPSPTAALARPTATRLPATATFTPRPTDTPRPTATHTPRPTSTRIPPTATFTPIPTSTSTPTPAGPGLGSTWVRPADGMVMVYVPAGEFQMGSTEKDSEQPIHTVVLDGFWIGRTEVTNAQYALCVAAGACEPPAKSRSFARDSYYYDSAYADYPVIRVSWYDAVNYCAWAGGRLPTEAEWEYAARGPEGHVYPWGNDTPNCDLANYSRDCVWDTAAVGSYPADASWCGALDMAGNVSEWVADWYGTYPSGRQENPLGPAAGDSRVVRGGCWFGNQRVARCSYRYGRLTEYSHNYLGFRCVSPVR